jgi:hypothetical protein
MKKFAPYFLFYFLFGWLITGDIINDHKISKLRKELEEVKADTQLAESGIIKLADITTLRFEWERKVAEKIRELDEAVKGIYEPRTNQIISRPILSM